MEIKPRLKYGEKCLTIKPIFNKHERKLVVPANSTVTVVGTTSHTAIIRYNSKSHATELENLTKINK